MKTKIVLYCLILSALIFATIEEISAQGAPAYAWVRNTLNGIDITYTAVATDNTNHFIYCAGSYQSGYFDVGTGKQYNASIGTHDIFVVKYDEGGNAIWAKSLGGFGDDHATGIACDGSGNIFITGYFDSDSMQMGTTVLHDTSATQLTYGFVAKMDGAGSIQWCKGAYSTGGMVQCNAITTDTYGNAYITGTFLLNAHFGNFAANSGFGGLFAVKYDNAGNEIWENNSFTYPGNGGTATGEAIAIDKDFNCIVSGSYVDTALFVGIPSLPQSNVAFSDRIVCKMDTQGHFVWAKGEGVWQGPDDNESVAVDDTGNIYLGGYLSRPTVSPVNTNYNTPYFLQKLNAAGAEQWIILGDTTTGLFHPLFADKAGNVFMAINILDTTQIPPFHINPVQLFGFTGVVTVIVKYDNTGACGWVKEVHAGSLLPPSAATHSIAHDDAGNIFITGSLQDTCYFDNQLGYGTFGSADFYLAKLGANPVSGITEAKPEEAKVVMYPNPANGTIHIAYELYEQSDVSIEVLDLTGRMLTHLTENGIQSPGKHYESIDISSIQQGNYLCKVNINGSIILRKLLVMR